MDPYEDYAKEHADEARKAREAEEAAKKAAAIAGAERGAWFSNPANRPARDGDASDGPVGKHLAKALAAAASSAPAATAAAAAGAVAKPAVVGASPTAGAAAAGPSELQDKDDYEAYAQQKKRRLAGKAELSDFSGW